METAGIITNLSKSDSVGYALEVVGWLRERGLVPIVTKELEQEVSTGCEALDEERLCAVSDFIIVLGGDGTILRAARDASLYDVPLFGINLGTLGYLTDAEKNNGFEALEKVINGDFKTEKRMMLEAEIYDPDYIVCSERLIALNDICVLRGAISKVIDLELFINGSYMDTFRADGIIVSTPTGSTAYNLSAGGPVFKPDIELIAITPICAHKMYSRSAVVSASDSVSLSIGECPGADPMLSLDGQEYVNLKKGQTIKIWKSEAYTTLIKTSDMSFYDILRMKLHQ